MKKAIRFATLAVTAVLLCAVAYAQQQPPAQIPLGDVVKQKAAKKAKKVVTEDDIPARAPEPDPAPAAVAVGGASDGRASGDAAMGTVAKTAAPNVSGEQARQNKIQELKGYEEAAKRIISKMEANLADPDLPDNRRQIYSDTLAAGHARLEQLTREREALEQQGAAPKPPATTTPQEQ